MGVLISTAEYVRLLTLEIVSLDTVIKAGGFDSEPLHKAVMVQHLESIKGKANFYKEVIKRGELSELEHVAPSMN